MPSGEDDRFEVRLGRVRSRSGARKVTSFMNGLERSAKGRSRSTRGRRGGRRSVRQMAFHRRVNVKASIKQMSSGGVAALRKHVDYIGRDGAAENDERAKLYGNGVETDVEKELDQQSEIDPERKEVHPAKSFLNRCKDDRHHFRFIVSPEDSARMQDLSGFTRDLVSRMERDLGTKLDWVAANHYDTGQPHVHLVVRGVRDDGKDLVIPRRYISQTLRERAQELASTELGPVSQMEGRVRLARTVQTQGFTRLDKELIDKLENGVLDMRGAVPNSRVWHRQLQVRRLEVLASMGLAERQGSGRWSVSENFEDTLRGIAERKDMVRAIHRSMERRGVEDGAATARRLVTERNRFDPNRLGATPVTGMVRHFGRPNDTRPGGFIVIEAVNGQALYTKVADDETFDSLRKGQVVTFTPHHIGPRRIDRSIVTYAEANEGIYSEARHATSSGRVSPAYAQAHARRLEALRRKGLVSCNRDGSWRVPGDYINRVTQYEAERAKRLPTPISRDSQQTLKEMQQARGVTWLDRFSADNTLTDMEERSHVFERAFSERAKALRELGIDVGNEGRLPLGALEKLEGIDLADAAKTSGVKDKPYSPLGKAKRIEGVYKMAIERPSGKFAVIERARDFTLVPWRPVMERRLGKSLIGRVSSGGISWDVTGRAGPSR